MCFLYLYLLIEHTTAHKNYVFFKMIAEYQQRSHATI